MSIVHARFHLCCPWLCVPVHISSDFDVLNLTQNFQAMDIDMDMYMEGDMETGTEIDKKITEVL
jgi:hypothetical protein